VTIAHNISNLKRVVAYDVTAGNNNGTTYPIGNSIFPLTIEEIDNTNIIANISSGFGSGWTIYYILYYVKV
jgi:hypothetical protein